MVSKLSLSVVLLWAFLFGHAVGQNVWFRSLTIGRSYRRGAYTMLECATECAQSNQCNSFKHTEKEGKDACDLAEGSAITRQPSAGSFVTFYALSKKMQTIIGQLTIPLQPTDRERARITGLAYPNQELASEECGFDQHLCQMWEVKKIVEEGNIAEVPENTDLWYAVPDSQVVVSDGEVTQHGLPMSLPAKGVCCPGPTRGPENPVLSGKFYGVTDQSGKEIGCSASDAHVCSLAELKAAFIRGYRAPSAWYFFDMTDRDAMLFAEPNPPCGRYRDIAGECYEGVIANTPRPGNRLKNVFCCPDIY